MTKKIELLKKSKLYCFTPDQYKKNKNIFDIVEEQLKGGADIIQLREKNISDRSKLELALKLKKIVDKYNKIFIINDDITICQICKADGIHLGQDDIPVKYARKILGNNYIIGQSTHNIIQYKEAQDSVADYTAIGPIWKTDSKKIPDPVIEIKNLNKILKYKKKFTVGIGGINYNRIDKLKKFKIDCIAVISDIVCSDNISNHTKKIKNKFCKEL